MYVADVTNIEPLQEVKFPASTLRQWELTVNPLGPVLYGFCLNHETDYLSQKYVNYFVLRFANEAVYNIMYRQSDAFPNVQCVKNISLEMCYPYDRSTL